MKTTSKFSEMLSTANALLKINLDHLTSPEALASHHQRIKKVVDYFSGNASFIIQAGTLLDDMKKAKLGCKDRLVQMEAAKKPKLVAATSARSTPHMSRPQLHLVESAAA